MPSSLDAEDALYQTERYWQEWAGRCTYAGPWKEAVLRSLLKQTRLPDQKRMAPGQNRGQHLLDHLVLSHEAPLDTGTRLQQSTAEIRDLVNQFAILGHDKSLILLYDI